MAKILITFLIYISLVTSANAVEPLAPISLPENLDMEKVMLGRTLFHDPQLSENGQISCASCHDIARGGVVPGLKYSMPGVNGEAEPINIPTVLNSTFNLVQFWDGRAKDLKEQVDGPIHNPKEMGINWPAIEQRLKQAPQYIEAFERIYGESPAKDHIIDAIVMYEEALVTLDAPFDLYLKGDKTALSALAKEGHELFKSFGCASCHQGSNIGGNMLQYFGVMDDYFENREGREIRPQDLGRYNVTGQEEDKYMFRVPSLRNVELTPPYFHDGSAKTLDDAIDVMAKYQLGRGLSDHERGALKAFLNSLTGILPPYALHENQQGQKK